MNKVYKTKLDFDDLTDFLSYPDQDSKFKRAELKNFDVSKPLKKQSHIQYKRLHSSSRNELVGNLSKNNTFQTYECS